MKNVVRAASRTEEMTFWVLNISSQRITTHDTCLTLTGVDVADGDQVTCRQRGGEVSETSGSAVS